jgi:alpha-galactosidase
VSSNYMAPLVSAKVDIGVQGENRVLFVPFDNDAFVRYSSKSMSTTAVTNTSAEVTAIYDNTSRRGLVVGSVEHTDWKTGIKTKGLKNVLSEFAVWGGYSEKAVTRDGIVHGTLSGASVKSPKIFVGLYDDWRTGLEDYGKANAIAEPRYVFDWQKPTPFGWNSWGAIQDKLNLDKAKAVANFFATSLPKFRNDNTAYIDLDSYWDNLTGGLNGDYSKLIDFVNTCKAKGLKAGIYWAPFVDWGKSNRQIEGSTHNYQDTWTKANGAFHDFDGARAMDPTHPGTQQRIAFVIDKFKKCGFEMIKVDFIGHAAIEADSYFDPNVKTGMQAFRKGMEYLVDQLESKMLVYVAISPSLATGRYAHSRRIACDAYSDISASEYTLNSTTYGWWQTYIYNYIDADHLVFKTESGGANRARFASGVINGTLITGDDFSTTGQWTETAKTLLQKEEILDIARHGVAFKPVEGNADQSASEVFVNKIGEYYYVAIINYGGKKSYDISLDRLDIPQGQYAAKELFSGNSFFVATGSVKREVNAGDAAILRLGVRDITGSVKEVAHDTAILYPNPSADVFRIESEKSIRAIQVRASDGKNVIEKKNIKSLSYELNMTGYKGGVYVVNVTYADGTTRVFKIMKK